VTSVARAAERERRGGGGRGGAKEVMKFKVTALKCMSHAENRKRGRMDFPAPGENANAWRGALRPRRKGRARAFERVRFSALLKLGEASHVLIFLGVVLRRCIPIAA